jgi:hypothetical protein
MNKSMKNYIEIDIPKEISFINIDLEQYEFLLIEGFELIFD